MQTQQKMTHILGTVFERKQATVLAEVITSAYDELVKTSDFNELKAIVKELAQAQNRTEMRMEELTQAQKETTLEIKRLTQTMRETNQTVGGLGQSMAYALENDAYRLLPDLLKQKYEIELSERLVRTMIGDEKVNFWGRGHQNGQEIALVGETKLRLDERRGKGRGQKDALEQLADKVKAVEEKYPDIVIVPLLVTHFARQKMLTQAEEQGVIVVQSFEW